MKNNFINEINQRGFFHQCTDQEKLSNLNTVFNGTRMVYKYTFSTFVTYMYKIVSSRINFIFQIRDRIINLAEL